MSKLTAAELRARLPEAWLQNERPVEAFVGELAELTAKTAEHLHWMVDRISDQVGRPSNEAQRRIDCDYQARGVQEIRHTAGLKIVVRLAQAVEDPELIRNLERLSGEFVVAVDALRWAQNEQARPPFKTAEVAIADAQEVAQRHVLRAMRTAGDIAFVVQELAVTLDPSRAPEPNVQEL